MKLRDIESPLDRMKKTRSKVTVGKKPSFWNRLIKKLRNDWIRLKRS